MQKEYSRDRRIAAIVQRVLAEILQRETDFSADMLTISAVQVDTGLAKAKVFITSLRDAPEHRQELLRTLNNNAPGYRRRLAGKLYLRNTPFLEFFYDRFQEDVRKVDRLLNELRKPGSSISSDST